MASGGSAMQPHVICLPFPAQSHISAMLKLAKLLHHRGLYITFVNTDFNHRRLLEARGPDFLDELPAGFQFVVIPDGLPQSRANATQALPSLAESVKFHMVAPFQSLVGDLNLRETSVSTSPPVSYIIADGGMTFVAFPASEKFEIPVVNFWAIPACSIMGLLHYPKLKEKGLLPANDGCRLESGYHEATIDWIPGMKNMRLCDMPNFFRTEDADDNLINFSVEIASRFDKAAATIFHTIEALELDVLSAFSSKFSRPAYAIGPFQSLIDRTPENDDRLRHISCNLWKEDTECLQWLDLQKPESVLYINFGSIAFLTYQQLVEFAMGIAFSKQPFLLIIRPDLVKGDAAILPPEFNEETNGRAFICEWCPQEEVLNHPSVGGFLTHCGWNSTLESLCAGVPMLCWPYLADQPTICKYLCRDWEVGLEIGNDVKRDGVERLVKELMEGEKGKQMKKRVVEWKQLALEATSQHGSSSTNLDKLVSEMINKKICISGKLA